MNIRTLIDKHRPRQPTEIQRQRFNEYVRAVENPDALIADFERGHVSPEVLETWETLYPEELDDFRGVVADEVERKLVAGATLGEIEVRTLNKLMGSDDGGYTAEMQRNYEQSEPDSAKTGQPGAPVNLSKSMSTPAQQAQQGRY